MVTGTCFDYENVGKVLSDVQTLIKPEFKRINVWTRSKTKFSFCVVTFSKCFPHCCFLWGESTCHLHIPIKMTSNMTLLQWNNINGNFFKIQRFTCPKILLMSLGHNEYFTWSILISSYACLGHRVWNDVYVHMLLLRCHLISFAMLNITDGNSILFFHLLYLPIARLHDVAAMQGLTIRCSEDWLQTNC